MHNYVIYIYVHLQVVVSSFFKVNFMALIIAILRFSFSCIKWLYYDVNDAPINNETSFVKVMACRPTGEKPQWETNQL